MPTFKWLPDRYQSTKFLFTFIALVIIFWGWWLGKDVRQLEIVVPSILGAYMAGNVGQSFIDNKYQAGTS